MSALIGGVILWSIGVFCLLTYGECGKCGHRQDCECAEPIPQAKVRKR